MTEEIKPKCVQSHRVERVGLGVQPFSVWDTHLIEQTKVEIQAGCAFTCFCFVDMFETGGTSDLGFWSTWLDLYFGARTPFVCVCVSVCMCTHAYGGQRWISGLPSSYPFWDTSSHQTYSAAVWVDQPASRLGSLLQHCTVSMCQHSYFSRQELQVKLRSSGLCSGQTLLTWPSFWPRFWLWPVLWGRVWNFAPVTPTLKKS